MKTYRGLRLMVRLFQVLGWALLAGGIALACAVTVGPSLAKGGPSSSPLAIGVATAFGAFTGISFVVGGVGFSATLFFAAGVIELLLDIQDNTYEQKEYLRRALTKASDGQSRQTSPAPGTPIPPGYKRP